MAKRDGIVLMKGSKQEKSPWVKGKKKTGPKKAKVECFTSPKKSDLAASDKGSWFSQPSADAVQQSEPSTSTGISASSRKPRFPHCKLSSSLIGSCGVTFPANFNVLLCYQARWGFSCCVSLVGGMTAY